MIWHDGVSTSNLVGLMLWLMQQPCLDYVAVMEEQFAIDTCTTPRTHDHCMLLEAGLQKATPNLINLAVDMLHTREMMLVAKAAQV